MTDLTLLTGRAGRQRATEEPLHPFLRVGDGRDGDGGTRLASGKASLAAELAAAPG